MTRKQAISPIAMLLFGAVILQLVLQMAHPWLSHHCEHRKVCHSATETHIHDEAYAIHQCDLCAVVLTKTVFILPSAIIAPSANFTTFPQLCQPSVTESLKSSCYYGAPATRGPPFLFA